MVKWMGSDGVEMVVLFQLGWLVVLGVVGGWVHGCWFVDLKNYGEKAPEDLFYLYD